jgi:tetratricopeptide (TPR) repeat protein
MAALAFSAAAAAPNAVASNFLSEAQQAALAGDTLGAVQLYQSAIIYAPAAPEPYNGLAQFYADRDQPDMAQKYYALALGVDPANAEALKGMALIDLAAGNLNQARERRELLARACGVTCPETAQVDQALQARGGLN